MPEIAVTEEGVFKQLSTLQENKASGPDKIPSSILKAAAKPSSRCFTLLYNSSLKSGSLPHDWCTANITPIFKKGERFKPSSYRPVSLTCICSKVIEHIIVSQLLDHFDNSPTLYSQITGKYASVESKIFPHILLLCSICYSCFNGLTINQHFIKPLQGEKCTSYLSVVDLSIVLPRVFFFAALCGRTNLRLRSRARTPTKLLRSTF